MANFLRQIDVYIEGLEYPLQYRGISKQGESYLYMTFSGEFSEEEDPNTLQLKVYNLSKSTISKLNVDKRISINAGYEGDTGNIAAGIIYKIISKKNGVDVVTEIHMQDATKNWITGSVSKTFQGTVKASYVIREVMKSLGMEIGKINLKEDKTYQTGKTVSGNLSDVIKQIANECGSRVQINNGKIDILTSQDGFDTGFVLGSETGLIGSPQYIDDYIAEIRDEDDDEPPVTLADYRIKMLLNHRVRPRSVFKINSLDQEGYFFAIKGRYNEDFTMDVDIKAL